MAAAAQAAAAAMRATRGESESATPGETPTKSGLQAKSMAGVRADGLGEPYASPATVTGVLKTGDWGKLPKKVAEELTQAQRESVPGEYRNQIETYYRVIAEKSKKP